MLQRLLRMDVTDEELATLREEIRKELATKLASSGGLARKAALSKKALSKIGRKAARARWRGHVKKKARR